MARVPFAEARRRAMHKQQIRAMRESMRAAFSDGAMLDHAPLIVWTKAQMRGVRSMIKRLGLT